MSPRPGRLGPASSDWVARALRCPSCAAPVQLDERAGVLSCGHCAYRAELDRGEAVVWHELGQGGSLARAAAESGQAESGRSESGKAESGPATVSCGHCGARMTRKDGALTTQCHYCLSNLALESAPADVEAFDGIVAFGISGREAREKFAAWLGDAWFAPGDLTRAAKIEELDSIFVPCHFWRGQARTEWRARVGILTSAADDKAAGHVRPAGDPGHVRTRWADQSGVIDEPVLELESASRVVTTKELLQLGGFESGTVVTYHLGFLGAHDAELPVIGQKESHTRMLTRLEAARESLAESQIDAERHKDFQARTTTSDVAFRLALVPVYLVTYRYNGSAFRVLVHGQTGVVEGDHPLSPWKIGLLLAILAAAVLAGFIALA